MNRYRVYPTADALAAASAAFIKSVIEEAVEARGRCCLALSGGNTPRLLFEYLSQPQFSCLPWNSVVLFWSDERFVPHSHADSNYRMAKESLLDRLPSQPIIFPVDTTTLSPQLAATSYEKTMRQLFDLTGEDEWPRFDCILLGVGADGHTASLFPGDKAVEERVAWATVGQAPNQSCRITLTLPVINAARQVVFLAAGSDKADVVAKIITREHSGSLPAAMVRTKEVVWLLDAAAASKLAVDGVGR